MKYWMERLPGRWIALRTGLLILALSLASLPIAAGGPEKNEFLPRNQTKREALRYGGRSFEQWRVELETELKPEIRVEGLTAMAAFGANGYGTEAARVIVDLIKGYHPNTDNERDKKVVAAAYEAIDKIEEQAYPALWQSLCGDNEHSHLFAFACFERSRTNWHPPVAELVKAMRDSHPETRETALGLLQNVKEKPRSCIPLLIECLKDDDHRGIRMEAMRNLNMIGPDATDALPQLRRLRDKQPNQQPTSVLRPKNWARGRVEIH